MELPARIGQMGIPPLEQPPFVECTCLRFSLHTFCVVHVDLNYCRHVDLRVLCMYRVNLIWCEAMLLVVNMVTCPIGTDCGGSAPVVGVIDNQGLQRAFCLHVLRTSSKTCKCHFECHINCMHSHSYNVAR